VGPGAGLGTVPSGFGTCAQLGLGPMVPGFGTCRTWPNSGLGTCGNLLPSGYVTWYQVDLGPDGAGPKWIWDLIPRRFGPGPNRGWDLLLSGFGTCQTWSQVDLGPVGYGSKPKYGYGTGDLAVDLGPVGPGPKWIEDPCMVPGSGPR
jgi:hypothetical protein